jgi:hypothetical protein
MSPCMHEETPKSTKPSGVSGVQPNSMDSRTMRQVRYAITCGIV